jgi:hypothetical protein
MTPAIVLAASGSGGGFDNVVHGIESRYHARATRIPFLGLMSGIARIATHGGVRNLHVVEFEHFVGDGPDGKIDGDEFEKLVEDRAGTGWQRIIRDTTRNSDEQSLIYVRPEGQQVGMMVVSLDGSDLNLVQISMNPDQLLEQIHEHQHHNRHPHADMPSDDADPQPAEN